MCELISSFLNLNLYIVQCSCSSKLFKSKASFWDFVEAFHSGKNQLGCIFTYGSYTAPWQPWPINFSYVVDRMYLRSYLV